MYWIKLHMQLNSVCAKKLLFNIWAFPLKILLLPNSPVWDFIYSVLQERLHCDFSLLLLRRFSFSVHNSPTTSFPKSPPDCCEICTLFQCRTVYHLDCSGTVVCASWSMDKLCTFQKYFVLGFIAFTSPFSKVLDFIIMQGCFFFSLLSVFRVLQAL